MRSVGSDRSASYADEVSGVRDEEGGLERGLEEVARSGTPCSRKISEDESSPIAA